MAFDLSEKMKQKIFAGTRSEHPDWPESEVKREFIRGHFPPDEIPPPFR